MTVPALGVVLVTFNSGDVILDCLESLLAAEDVWLDIVIVDNASTDGTPQRLRDWASGRQAYTPPGDLPFPLATQPKPVKMDGAARTPGGHRVMLKESGGNLGFAAGVNLGLAELAGRPGIDRFWILNPDSAVPPGSAAAFARQPAPAEGFALMGGRVFYLERPDQIQIDGGRIDWRTGRTHNANQYAPADTPVPDPEELDFITGASMVASREFYVAAGPLPEDYFLYYEEVEWALRRGDLPLAYCPGGVVYHRAGTSIGSQAPGRPASPFSLYFIHRARLMFIRRHRPGALPGALAFSLAKAGQLALKGYPREAAALLAGSFGRSPPAGVRARLSEAAFSKIFG
ncbi:MAG: glycosyltransferase family 2 protein [Pseudooceanicola nanhaiensis]